MTTSLPIKLRKEPLVDVAFEIRFTAGMPVSSILPGILFSNLPGMQSIEALPASNLPQQMRSIEPTLQFAPLNRLHWGQYLIAVGDNVVALACKMPYPGWSTFKAKILEVAKLLHESQVLNSITRCSLKYTDQFDTGKNLEKAVNIFSLKLVLGSHSLHSENLVLRLEIPRDDLIHAIQIATDAKVQFADQPPRIGAILEVDSVLLKPLSDPNEYFPALPELLDSIHSSNKEVFFSCLSQSGLAGLEPIYESTN